jgi:phosphatidylglycerophosphate synthase
MEKIRWAVPWAMAAARALLGPVVIVGDRCKWSPMALAGLVVTALLSDVFDGALARRWRVDTAGVRLFDSMCDLAFYVCVGVALWLYQPQILHGNLALLYALLAIEAANFAANFAKFGRPASYHSYLAKAWGLMLAGAIAIGLAAGDAGWLMRVALLMGIASNAETIAMSLMLPVWRRDVKTIAEAWRIRKEICGGAARNMPQGTSPERCGRFAGWVERAITWVATGVIAGLSLMATSAFAAQPENATYYAGTASVPASTKGVLDMRTGTALKFNYRNADGTTGQFIVNYEAIRGIEPRQEPLVHLGVLPLIAVSLVAHPSERHLVTIDYTDASGVAQVAVFEVSKLDQSVLVDVVNARSPRGCTVNRVPCPPALVRR